MAPTAEKAYVPRYFLLFVDLGHISPNGRLGSLDALKDFIAQMGSNDRARIGA